MSRFNECLHGPLEEIGDTGNLTDAELRALAQNLCLQVLKLQARADYQRDRITDIEARV